MKLLGHAKNSWRTNFKLMFQKLFTKRPEDYFPAWGKVMVIGGMGSGKGVSVTWYITQMLRRYPKAYLITNDYNFDPSAFGLKNQIYYVNSREEYHFLMMNLKNFGKHDGEYQVRSPYPMGVVAMLDEINKYKGEESDEGFEMGGYLRKLSILEINQTQIYKRAALQVREQTTEIWKVTSILGVFQMILSYDATTVQIDKMDEAAAGQANMRMKLNNIRFFWHNEKIYSSYNSYSLLDEIKQLNYTKKEQEQYYDFIQNSHVDDYLIYKHGRPLNNYHDRIYVPCRDKTFNVPERKKRYLYK